MKALALLLWLVVGCTTPTADEPGEPLEDVFEPRCVVGSPRTSHWEIGPTRFRAHYCASNGGSGTTAFRVVRLKVQEGSAAPVTLEGKDLSDRFVARYNHLNACDSFRLRLGTKTYAVTGPANAGCGPVAEDAPERTFADRRRGSLARVREGAGAWQNFDMPCGHWLFECGP